MSDAFAELLQTIQTLRGPGGCPWDRKQTLTDAAGYLLDEAGELLDAALAGDLTGVREELGDLLFMTFFCGRILADSEPVTMQEIARQGHEKLVRRHPHVFGPDKAHDSEESQERWNEIKAQEKRAKGIDTAEMSVLKDLPASSSPLHQAHEYQRNAAEVGFDWPDIDGVWAKLHEEIAELAQAGDDPAAREHELGDLLFTVVNLARWLKVKPDQALRRANQRFRSRFQRVEAEFRSGKRSLAAADIDELEAAWNRAKAHDDLT